MTDDKSNEEGGWEHHDLGTTRVPGVDERVAMFFALAMGALFVVWLLWWWK